jgi:hypothetical protein
MCFVDEIGGNKICVEVSRKAEVFEILRDTWLATSTNVSISLLDIQLCNVSDGLLWSIVGDGIFVLCLESPKHVKLVVYYFVDNPCTQLDFEGECGNLFNLYIDLNLDELFDFLKIVVHLNLLMNLFLKFFLWYMILLLYLILLFHLNICLLHLILLLFMFILLQLIL